MQLGINDQFLENNDGNGAGIEDMNLGMAKVSVAFAMDPNNSANDNRFALPIRATGIKTLPNGELSVYVTPSAQLKSKNQVTNVRSGQNSPRASPSAAVPDLQRCDGRQLDRRLQTTRPVT